MKAALSIFLVSTRLKAQSFRGEDESPFPGSDPAVLSFVDEALSLDAPVVEFKNSCEDEACASDAKAVFDPCVGSDETEWSMEVINLENQKPIW